MRRKRKRWKKRSEGPGYGMNLDWVLEIGRFEVLAFRDFVGADG